MIGHYETGVCMLKYTDLLTLPEDPALYKRRISLFRRPAYGVSFLQKQ